jgi:hypothetical protein
LIACLEVRTAGDPDDEDIVFTDFSPQDLSDILAAAGIFVGRDATAKAGHEAARRFKLLIMITRRGLAALSFLMGFTIASPTGGISTSGLLTIRLNLPATASAGTGTGLASSVTPTQHQY